MLNLLRRILFDPRFRLWWAVASVLLAAVLIWLATLPSHRKPPTSGWDKFDHLFAFSAFALGLWFWFRAGTWRWLRVLAVCLAFGVAIEVAQLFVPSRRSEVIDVVADMVGAVLGVAIAYAVQKLLDRRRLPRGDE